MSWTASPCWALCHGVYIPVSHDPNRYVGRCSHYLYPGDSLRLREPKTFCCKMLPQRLRPKASCLLEGISPELGFLITSVPGRPVTHSICRTGMCNPLLRKWEGVSEIPIARPQKQSYDSAEASSGMWAVWRGSALPPGAVTVWFGTEKERNVDVVSLAPEKGSLCIFGLS